MLLQEPCTQLLERCLVVNPHESYWIRDALTHCHCNVKVNNKLNVNVIQLYNLSKSVPKPRNIAHKNYFNKKFHLFWICIYKLIFFWLDEQVKK